MAQAVIEINGVAGSDDDLPINTLVQLSNADAGGELTYAWTITDQPEGAAVALSNPAIENPTFTPTKEGTYRLRLVVNTGLGDEVVGYAVAAVRHLRTHERAPAAGELLEADGVRGWATAVNRQIQRLTDGITDGNVVAAINGTLGAISPGTVVYFPDIGTLKSGLPGEERLPRAWVADADVPNSINWTMGIALGAADGGSWTTGKVGLVRIRGMVDVLFAGSPTAGDPVFVSSTAGAVSLTPGAYPRIIGRVAYVSGGQYRIYMDGEALSAYTWPRVTNPSEMYTLDASWVFDSSSSDGLFWQTTGTIASGLMVPLKVNRGEVLYRVDMDIYQFNTTSRMTVELVRSRAFVGSGQVYASEQTPAAAGLQAFQYTAGLATPVQCGVGECLSLHVIGSDVGIGSRNVGAVHAWVRPPI